MGCLRAAGDVKYTLFASVTSITVVRTAFTCLLVLGLHWGLTGVWLGVLTDQACQMCIRDRSSTTCPPAPRETPPSA